LNNFKFLFAIVFLAGAFQGQAQTLYVDAINGKNVAQGTASDPFLSLEKAVAKANTFRGDNEITIKIARGLYILHNPLKIENASASANYFIEALVMPDDTAWRPDKMPVIQSVAVPDAKARFKKCVAFDIERSNVVIRGLKFIGNPSPEAEYFYAIERHNEKLSNLLISQCYFLGEKTFAPIQGAVFAQGAGIHIDHCIFYGCKNAALVFLGLKDFSLTHSVIYGAYEAAMWYGYGEGSNTPFTFSNNVVSNCNYLLVSDKASEHHYTFSNSVISNNQNYLGFNGMEVEGPDLKNTPIETNIDKTGSVILNEVTAKGVPVNYLNLAPNSAGYNLNAGIFKKP